MIGFLLGVPTRLKLYAAIAGGFLLAVAAAFLKGRRGAIKEAEWKRLTDYKNTRKAMDDVEPITDPDEARDWLRNRADQ